MPEIEEKEYDPTDPKDSVQIQYDNSPRSQDKYEVLNVAIGIDTALVWGQTAEGWDFWKYVYDRLRELADADRFSRAP